MTAVRQKRKRKARKLQVWIDDLAAFAQLPKEPADVVTPLRWTSVWMLQRRPE